MGGKASKVWTLKYLPGLYLRRDLYERKVGEDKSIKQLPRECRFFATLAYYACAYLQWSEVEARAVTLPSTGALKCEAFLCVRPPPLPGKGLQAVCRSCVVTDEGFGCWEHKKIVKTEPQQNMHLSYLHWKTIILEYSIIYGIYIKSVVNSVRTIFSATLFYSTWF